MTAKTQQSVKLTLKLRKDIIERGKAFAQQRGTSLSKLVEEYLEAASEPPYQPTVTKPDPDVVALMGGVKNRRLQTNRELYAEYYEARRQRYLGQLDEAAQ